VKTFTIGDGAARALLLHGNDLCAEFYAPLAERLAAREVATRLVTLPGFHDQPPLRAPSWTALVDVVIEALPAPDGILIGHSMGGLIALLAAARRPPALARLVLLEPTILPTRWLARLAGRRYLQSVVRGDHGRFVNWNGGMRRVHDLDRFPAAAIELYLAVRRASDRATAEQLFATLPDLYPLPFGRVVVPTLLVTGARSGWWAGRLFAAVRARLPSARHEIVADAAHWLANEQDEAVAECLARFVR
jgi:pimeloyl-ACP methyl ester carboxylesterase